MAQDRSPGPADRGLPNIFALQVGKESIVAVVGAALAIATLSWLYQGIDLERFLTAVVGL